MRLLVIIISNFNGKGASRMKIMKLTGVVDFCEVYKNVQGIILKMLISMSRGLVTSTSSLLP